VENIMAKLRIAAGFTLFLSIAFAALPVGATFHLWKFTEFYSNLDGSVQFIEMLDPSNFEEQVGGKTITSASTGKTFTFNVNLPSTSTAGRRMLIATAGFGSLPGGVTPDYTLPSSNFFNPAGDTITFAGGFDVKVFASVPTDGIMSRIYPSNTLATNSPTNFAGAGGQRGDYNGDGVVSAADYVVWRNTFGQAASPAGVGADGNTSGSIDNGDYTHWRARFGNVWAPGPGSGTGAGQVSIIPEPGAIVLFLTGLATLSLARRR
jgi:hypothetical protein